MTMFRHVGIIIVYCIVESLSGVACELAALKCWMIFHGCCACGGVKGMLVGRDDVMAATRVKWHYVPHTGSLRNQNVLAQSACPYW